MRGLKALLKNFFLRGVFAFSKIALFYSQGVIMGKNGAFFRVGPNLESLPGEDIAHADGAADGSRK
jgi:hypothetical protein